MRFLAVDPLQAKTLPVAWVQAMVNWFKQFENYPGSRVEARIVHGGNDKTVSYRHNLPLLDRRYQRGSILTPRSPPPFSKRNTPDSKLDMAVAG